MLRGVNRRVKLPPKLLFFSKLYRKTEKDQYFIMTTFYFTFFFYFINVHSLRSFYKRNRTIGVPRNIAQKFNTEKVMLVHRNGTMIDIIATKSMRFIICCSKSRLERLERWFRAEMKAEGVEGKRVFSGPTHWLLCPNGLRTRQVEPWIGKRDSLDSLRGREDACLHSCNNNLRCALSRNRCIAREAVSFP